MGSIVGEAAPRPEARRGEDARLYARRALDYGDRNAAALADTAAAYGALVEAMAHPPPAGP